MDKLKELLGNLLGYVDEKKLISVNLDCLLEAAEKAAADTTNTDIDDRIVDALKLLKEKLLS